MIEHEGTMYTNINDLLSNICEIKEYVLKLHGQELRNYRHTFFNQKNR